jgi:putative spermidine/putrescine transport system substrate-binding protein
MKESAFGIPKGARDVYWGQKFLALVAEAKPQGVYANIIGYPGLNLDATKYTDAKLIPFLPTSEENFPKQFWTDLAWWNEHGPAIQERWSRWMLQK